MIKMIQKFLSPRKIFYFAVVLSIVGIAYTLFFLQHDSDRMSNRSNGPFHPPHDCNHLVTFVNNHHLHNRSANVQSRQRVLIFRRTGRNQLGRDIVQLVESVRFKYQVHDGDVRNLPVLIDDNKGRYAVIIFEDVSTYLNLNQWNREMLDKYCLKFQVGMISFIHPTKSNHDDQSYQSVGNFPLKFATGFKLKNYELNPSSSLLRIARPGEVWDKCLDSDWSVFELLHPTYEPVSYTMEASADVGPNCDHKSSKSKKKLKKFRRNLDGLGMDLDHDQLQGRLPTVVHDKGKLDGIQRVFFGSGVKFWLHKVLLLDSLSFLSRGRLSVPLERYVQIDIDDIFVGNAGHRMNADDVMALIAFQEKLRKSMPGFTFQLGFSGKFIYSGDNKETDGDRLFLKVHDRFSWFPHMWSHMQAPWFNNVVELCQYMDVNHKFALRWHFNISSHYAVAPHHAGVFPVHEQLYECWRSVWNITTTSTEEYPHLRPDYKRRGFMYKGVKVLPRQTCGLFTHTMILHLYPGGPNALHAEINGGPLFQTFLYNQFNIFMTHLSNYGNDRLAIYTFDRVIKFVQCWTNLRLLYVEPETMADMYFKLYPEELDPVWLNPCNDKRHFEIWSEKKSCDSFPKFVIVGPQKTGTTALYWYLNMHPDVQSNKPSEKTFEEIQFFNGENYYNGIDWYMNFFEVSENETVLFEKSATYFDQSVVPKRLSSLLPNTPVVVVLIDPAKRAYSWYQHMRSHDDKTANQYSFYEVIRARRKSSPPALISLQQRCLDPGFYADHLEKWLEYINAKDIVIVDGEELRLNPVEAMNELQTSLGFKKKFNYNQVLTFDEKKGFFCQLLESGKTKCLGISKGRKYPDMDLQSREFLTKYYSEANIKLVQILKNMNKSTPRWLANDS